LEFGTLLSASQKALKRKKMKEERKEKFQENNMKRNVFMSNEELKIRKELARNEKERDRSRK
jgi:hypothetical protein